MNENDKVQVQLGVTVPLGGTTSTAVSLDGRRILSVEQAADYQGDWLHLEHSTDGVNFVPLLSVERSSNRLLLLDLPGAPTSGFIRIRLDEVQSNSHGFTILTR